MSRSPFIEGRLRYLASVLEGNAAAIREQAELVASLRSQLAALSAERDGLLGHIIVNDIYELSKAYHERGEWPTDELVRVDNFVVRILEAIRARDRARRVGQPLPAPPTPGGETTSKEQGRDK